MSLETQITPWAYDELQLIGAELGDTVDYTSQKESVCSGVIVFLNKMTIFVLNPDKKIIRFSRNTLNSLEGEYEILGLSDTPIKISSEEWKQARSQIKKK